MKKFVSVVAVLALVAFAAPALAATNPFMDVPMNHWAYDAIGQLAAHGILSGYPDGTYKGKQPTTRYEMASALARALAVVDMTKASRQDVEMLQKLVVEFHDELEALGVRVDEIEGKVNKLDERLGGWKISGRIRLDITNMNNKEEPDAKSDVTGANYRIFLERFFGEDEQFHFLARLDSQGDAKDGEWSNAGKVDDPIRWSLFYVDMPFFFDSRLTVGKFDWDFEGDYRLGGTFALPTIGEQSWGSAATDQRRTGIGIEKQFGMGNFRAYVAHPKAPLGSYKNSILTDSNGDTHYINSNYSAWEGVLGFKFQFTEQFGFDLGTRYNVGDNAAPDMASVQDGDVTFDKLWTIWAGLRFDFNENIGFNGIYYYQKKSGDKWNNTLNDWEDAYGDDDTPSLWKVAFSIKQDALKFTSAWLEYGQAKAGFYQGDHFLSTGEIATVQVPSDLKYWKIGLGQEWNEKWATRLFYTGYSFDQDYVKAEWGLGVQYTMNSNVKFDLGYTTLAYDGNKDDDHMVRLRTQVTF